MLSLFCSKVYSDFFNDRNNWVLWIPVFFTMGIILNLSLKLEPNLLYASLISFILLITSFIFKKEIKFWIFIILFFISLGFLITSLRIKLVESQILLEEVKYAQITGKLSSITPYPKGYKIIISNPKIDSYPELKLKNIRLNIRTEMNNILIGDIITLKATLMPPPKPPIIDGYNFAFKAYFEQLGGIGYSLSKIKVIESQKSEYLQNLRMKIGKAIIEVLGPSKGNIAAALMIGEYNGIDKKILESMRISGISHILSVSGMHLSLAAALFFFFSRILLNLLPFSANYFNVKKLAAIIAIIGSLGYLLISGTQIAAIRSFIMTGMIIVAIILDRVATPIRSVMFAYFIILLFQPESIVNPSFQMSFAAVIALIACYDYYIKFSKLPNNDNGIIYKILFYLFSTFFSSIVASIATSPFAAYHFNQFSGYGVITNLIAVPLSSFIIMPCVILAFIFYPFNLHKLPLIIMGYGIEGLIKSSDYISSIPGSVAKVPQIPIISLILISLAGFWFTLWQAKWRKLFWIFLIPAFLIYLYTPKADIIISNKQFAFRNHKNNLVFGGKKISSFNKEAWMNYYGQNEFLYDDNKNPTNFSDFQCDNLICSLRKNNYTVQFIKKDANNIQSFNGDLIVDYNNMFIDKDLYINANNLENGNLVMVFLNSKIKILYLNNYLGKRNWNR